MTIDEKIESLLSNTDVRLTHAEKIQYFIEYLGKEKVRNYIPIPMEMLKTIYLLNDTDFAISDWYDEDLWMSAVGFTKEGGKLKDGLYTLLDEKGVDKYDVIDCLELLSRAADLWVLECIKKQILQTINIFKQEQKDVDTRTLGQIKASKKRKMYYHYIENLQKTYDKIEYSLFLPLEVKETDKEQERE